VYPERNAYIFSKRGEKPIVTIETVLEKATAPIKKGTKVGEIQIFKDGVEIDRINLLAEKDISKANFFDRLQDVAQDWNKR